MDYGYLTCTGPSIACYGDSDCDDGDPCTTDTCNNPGDPASNCSHTQITNCIDNDGCCPTGCDATNDNDCGAVCGDGAVNQPSEECDDGDLNGKTCSDFGYSGGTLSCYPQGHTNECTFNKTGCSGLPAAFSCHIESGSCSTGNPVLALSAQNNSHAETNTAGNYDYKLCCSNISSVQTTTGTGDCNTLGAGFTGLVTFATNSTFDKNTNAQVERYNYTGTDGFSYKKNVCVELTSGSLNCIYDTKANCFSLGYNKYVVSISDSTNAHVGDEDAYSIVRCCKKIS